MNKTRLPRVTMLCGLLLAGADAAQPVYPGKLNFGSAGNGSGKYAARAATRASPI